MKPTIYTYLDHRSFLSDWFAWKKTTNRRFSHRGFARRIGQRSPSVVVDVIAGRRNLTSDIEQAFIDGMKLSQSEARFFHLLVALERASTADDKHTVWTQIVATQRWKKAHKLEGESFQYLSDWCYPAIRELAARSDFRADPAWIAATLRPTITRKKAKEALSVLFDLGMLVQSDNGTIEQADGAIVTPSEVLGLAVHNYHQGMLNRAIDGIEEFKSSERHYTGLTVCVPSGHIHLLKEELNRFAERLLEICDGAEEPPQRVYQLQLLAFPLSSDAPIDAHPPQKDS